MEYRLRTLSGLLAFEAAARHGSLTAAAQELARTQSAVSQQVKGLEEEIGLPLFVRRPREVTLTPAGRCLADVVTASLGAINHKIDELRRRAEPNVIRLTVYHSFAVNWLIPRLPNFGVRRPELDVRIGADDRKLDLIAGGFDLAIRGVRRGQPAPQGSALMRGEVMIPVYSPALSPDTEITADDMRHYPLLREEDRSLWQEWLDLNGQPGPAVLSGKAYSHTGLLVQAAMVGAGIALVPVAIAAEALKAGRLCCVRGQHPDSGYMVHIVVAEDPVPEKVAAFVDWFQDEMQLMDEEMRAFIE
ncbi:LysR substrate-binding domain-containing protein [Pseudokordiimonas caeni]|uniref:LysR substrate-binding domain-containing protein n=1 Tax=Pseudokordiimonas caeni TaxID=2997908 RepID=UPI002811FA82|nr:LysR substrate-binding domain-containing protein [Pseudokordiimonas caeni]